MIINLARYQGFLIGSDEQMQIQSLMDNPQLARMFLRMLSLVITL